MLFFLLVFREQTTHISISSNIVSAVSDGLTITVHPVVGEFTLSCMRKSEIGVPFTTFICWEWERDTSTWRQRGPVTKQRCNWYKCRMSFNRSRWLQSATSSTSCAFFSALLGVWFTHPLRRTTKVSRRKMLYVVRAMLFFDTQKKVSSSHHWELS